MDNKPIVTVIIPCFNAIKTIGSILTALKQQKTDFPYEIIVVDSSDDGTTEIIRSFPEVHLIRLERQTLPGSGRNLGVSHAQGEIVAFTDSDCVPDPDWLSRILSQHRSKDTDGVGGCVINGYPRSITAWVSHLIEFNEWTERTPERFVTNIPSCNLSFKRDSIIKYRIHYTDIFPSEDTLFNWDLTEKGGKIYFDPKIRITHLSRVGFRKLFKHQHTLGKASAEARRISTLPGKIFTRYSALCLVMPFIRWIRAIIRLFKNDKRTLVQFIALTPIYFPAVIMWTIGFMTKGSFSDPVYVIKPESQ
jgi:glycosyltransferase involved in cell wall biosynthesis